MIKLEKDEPIIMEVRKHWLVFLGEVLVCLVMVIAPLFLLPVIKVLDFHPVSYLILVSLFLYILWFLAVWIMAFIFWTNYYLDVWIFTNQRILDVDQKKLFVREVSTLRYEKIQDVTYEINGIINSFLNVGNVIVQTAGAQNQFIIRGVKNPDYVQKKLNEILIRNKLKEDIF